MKSLHKFLKWTVIIVGGIGLVLIFAIVFNKTYFNTSFIIDPDLASKFGSFFGGFIGTFFALISTILILYSLVNQNIESSKANTKSNFFKMLDYHNQNVQNIKVPHLDATKQNIIEEGRRVFVTYKIQIKRLIELVSEINNSKEFHLSQIEIADIAYICFYYGIDDRWEPFIKEKLKKYPNSGVLVDEIHKKVKENTALKLGRTNQTDLSCYYRNMYNAIKLVDKDELLSKNDKHDLIKVFRAQLSNPELYVLFFNLISRFGNKWNSNKYINRYSLIKNLPKDYCDGYNPKDFFNISFEYEEEE